MTEMSDPTIRLATPDDAPALLAIYEPYVRQTAITCEYEVPSVEEFAGRIERTLKRYPYLVMELDGRPIGYAYVSPLNSREAYDWSVETSIYLARDVRHGGLGRKLHDALKQCLIAMGITNMCALIAVPHDKDCLFIHISEPTRRTPISYAVFCLKKKKKNKKKKKKNKQKKNKKKKKKNIKTQ